MNNQSINKSPDQTQLTSSPTTQKKNENNLVKRFKMNKLPSKFQNPIQDQTNINRSKSEQVESRFLKSPQKIDKKQDKFNHEISPIKQQNNQSSNNNSKNLMTPNPFLYSKNLMTPNPFLSTSRYRASKQVSKQTSPIKEFQNYNQKGKLDTVTDNEEIIVKIQQKMLSKRPIQYQKYDKNIQHPIKSVQQLQIKPVIQPQILHQYKSQAIQQPIIQLQQPQIRPVMVRSNSLQQIIPVKQPIIQFQQHQIQPVRVRSHTQQQIIPVWQSQKIISLPQNVRVLSATNIRQPIGNIRGFSPVLQKAMSPIVTRQNSIVSSPVVLKGVSPIKTKQNSKQDLNTPLPFQVMQLYNQQSTPLIQNNRIIQRSNFQDLNYNQQKKTNVEFNSIKKYVEQIFNNKK